LRPDPDWQVTLGGRVFHVALHGDDVTVDGETVDLDMEYTPGDRIIHAEIGEDALTVKIEPTRKGLTITTRGAIHKAAILPARLAPLAKHMIEKVPPDLSKFLICPMPGLLVSLSVKAGDKVEAGQPLAVVEAMKMENILRAENPPWSRRSTRRRGTAWPWMR
jgi:propionyl-CoA carboxylase alpha chain